MPSLSPERIAGLDEYLALASAARADLAHESEKIPLSEIELRAPVRPRKTVFCVGRNYVDDAEEIARANGQQLKLPSVPTVFTKAPTSIADPERRYTSRRRCRRCTIGKRNSPSL